MKNCTREIRFAIAGKNKFRMLLNQLILQENSDIDIQGIDYKFALDALEKILLSTAKATGTDGYIVADDFNFIAAQYNVVRAITSHLQIRNLPQAYKDEMSRYYSNMIISKGQDKNYVAENEAIDRIPDGGKVVYIGDRNVIDEVTCLNETNLQTILIKVCPQAASLTKDEFQRALQLICRINPSTSFSSVRDKKTKERTDSYSAEVGHVILIPDFITLKNAKGTKN